MSTNNEQNIGTVVFSKSCLSNSYIIVSGGWVKSDYHYNDGKRISFIGKEYIDDFIKDGIDIEHFNKQIKQIKALFLPKNDEDRRIREFFDEQNKILPPKFRCSLSNSSTLFLFLADFPEYLTMKSHEVAGNKCPTCGHIEEVICQRCGKNNDNGVDCCWNCGAKI